MSTAQQTAEATRPTDMPLVDCDIHIPTDGEAVAARMPEPFRSKGISGPGSGYTSPIGVTRRDAIPDSETSSLDLLREKVLDPLGIEHGIITGGVGSGLVGYENVRQATAIASAYNEWVIEEWAEADERLHASIGIAPHAPEDAAAEIERWGDHPEMVQVITGSGTREPIGQRQYWPIFDAATEHDLPIAMHIGPKGKVGIGNPNNPAGESVTYGEGHIAQSFNYYGQLASLVLEGAFEEFPDLRFVFIEGEFAWVPDLMWRMDRYYEMYSEELPWLSMRPSEYVIRNARFTTQPIPEPPRHEHFQTVLEMVHAEETVMFCTDYPHWDGDYSPQQLFGSLPASMQRAIFHENAEKLYGF